MADGTLVDRIHRDALAAIGRMTTVELGDIDGRNLARFEVAVDGSVEENILGLAAPLYLSSVLAWGAGPTEGDLLPDGNAADPFGGLDVAGLRVMAGGQELAFVRDLAPGASVNVEVTLESVDLKETSEDRMLIFRLRRRYFDDLGTITECLETFLGREALE